MVGERVGDRQVRDVDDAIGVQHGNDERLAPAEQRQADGVIARVEHDREGAISALQNARRADAESATGDHHLICRRERNPGVERLLRDVLEVADDGGSRCKLQVEGCKFEQQRCPYECFEEVLFHLVLLVLLIKPLLEMTVSSVEMAGGRSQYIGNTCGSIHR